MLKEKYLDIEYLTNRLKTFDLIRSGKVEFTISKSNREDSKSVYVSFYCNKIKGQMVRFSDHYLSKCVHTQVIVDPTKKEKSKKVFDRTINKAISKTIANAKFILFKRIENDDNRKN